MIRWFVFAVFVFAAPTAWGQQTIVSSCGTKSYTAGSTANETQDTNGQTC